MDEHHLCVVFDVNLASSTQTGVLNALSCGLSVAALLPRSLFAWRV
jgi:hypothetical protein